MTPEQREHLKQNWDRWQKMTPAERDAARQRLQQMSPDERRAAREQWRRPPPPHR